MKLLETILTTYQCDYDERNDMFDSIHNIFEVLVRER